MSARAELYALDFPNGKRYIGISKNARTRFAYHLCAAKRGVTFPVYNAIRKYQDSITFRILAVGTREYIEAMEVRAIAIYETRNPMFGYNVQLGGGKTRYGLKNSEQHRARISCALTGKPLSEEHVAKLRGYKHTPEAKSLMSTAKAGTPLTKEHRQKIGEGGKGKIRSAESRQRYSASKLGDLNPMKGKTHTPEARAKIAAASKLRVPPHSPEVHAKISATKAGVPWSPARRAAFERAKK